jgi:hypothetical protein
VAALAREWFEQHLRVPAGHSVHPGEGDSHGPAT